MKHKKFTRKILLSVSLFFLLTSSAFTAAKKWTVMVYFAADNNLEGSAIDDFLEISQVGSDQEVNLLVQLDRRSGYDTRYGDWTICHRFYVTQGMEPYESSSIYDWGDGKGGREVNNGIPETLTDFISWGVSNYPAERYCVILWNHGSGWKTLEAEGKPVMSYKEICQDTTSGDILSTRQVREAFEDSGKYINLIGFDACLMGMLEVANEIKSLGDVMVASEQTEPVSGWNFSGFLSQLRSNPSMGPYQLGESIVSSYIGHGGNGETLAAIDLGGIDSFNQALDALVEYILLDNEQWLNVYVSRQSAQSFDESFFIDLYDFLEKLLASVSDPLTYSLAMDAMGAFSDLVVSNYAADGYSSHGLSIYFPAHGSSIDPSYNGNVILFASQTSWKAFLSAFVSADLFSGLTSLYADNFSQGLPSGWSIIDGKGDGFTWKVKNSQPRIDISSPFLEPPYMMVDSDAAGYVDMDEQLISPSYDFTGYGTVYIRFNHLFWYYTEEIADVDVRVNGGAWQNVRRYRGTDSSGTMFADISAIAAGRGNVQVRWHYYNANYDWFWAVDSVSFMVSEIIPLGPGDINSDGKIDISDVLLCLRMAVGLDITLGQQTYPSPYPAELITLANINEDAGVDITDVILILRLSVGLE